VNRLSEIRPFARADAGAVAALFQKTFRNSAAAPSEALRAHLVEVYLDHPWYDPETAARVHVNDAGRVTGFVGVFPGRFEHQGRTLRAAIAGTLMVEHPEREPLAGAKLLRSVIKGPQDITLSETTNLISQALWERLGGSVVPLVSLDWFRVFRPSSSALSVLAERYPAAAMLSPVARLGDAIASGWTRAAMSPAEPAKPMSVNDSPSDAEFAAAIFEFSQAVAFRPAWSAEVIQWLLRHAAEKERYGTMRRAILRDGKGGLAGCYLYHGKTGGTGRVLQVLARKGDAALVVDALFLDASGKGLAALRGRSTPELIDALLTRSTLFLHRASMAIHPTSGEAADAIRSGDALITGLAGESWTRLVGGVFH
jgi:hypothetical protein